MTPRTVHAARRNWRDSRGWLARTGYYGVAALIALGFLFPLVFTLTRSLQGPAGNGVPTLQSLAHLTIENYRGLSGSGSGLWRYVANSTLIGVTTAVGTVLVSTLAGYGLSRLRFRGSGVAFLIILTPFMVPFQSILTLCSSC